MSGQAPNDLDFNAWNPGIESRIPTALEPMITLYRPGNTTVDYKRAKELSDFCGISADQLIVFSVERLIIHELLIRVTSDLSVPDGPNYEDLGINLRTMVAQIYGRLLPEVDRFQRAYDEAIDAARSYIQRQLDDQLFNVPSVQQKSQKNLLHRLFGKASAKKPSSSFSDPVEFKALAFWNDKLGNETESARRLCLLSLTKIISAVVSQRGRVMNEPELLATIATNYASNKIGDELISELVGELFESCVEQEGYRLLPLQEKPVVMNVKGASASGKSTIRPQQQQLAVKLGIPWEDFALISPDYWRKYLLDYESLGKDYKYAAMLTGRELEIIDKKLDRYMAQKARRGAVPHLLIDRFRFDSFSVEDGRSQDSKLLSRFGDRIYLFFMITPPDETVVRAWERGKTTGRYKAVDDLLFHNIEAYTGIPDLFFSWVLSSDKQVHFEFLNNDVQKGCLPKTIAFGRNKCMTILDTKSLCNIDTYRRVNIEAKNAEDVLPTVPGSDNSQFLSKCISNIKEVQFAATESAALLAKFEAGKLVWFDKARCESSATAVELQDLLQDADKSKLADEVAGLSAIVDDAESYTLGDRNAAKR